MRHCLAVLILMENLFCLNFGIQYNHSGTHLKSIFILKVHFGLLWVTFHILSKYEFATNEGFIHISKQLYTRMVGNNASLKLD